MKKVLFVDCCIRRKESRSKALAEHFLEEIKKTGDYEIETLCLMDEPLSYMTEGFFLQREELLAQKKLDHPRFHYAHQFAEADKIVIAAPFWDLSIPALLKVYIENLCVEGITFGASEKGLAGLCKADHMVFITARGAIYENSPLEMGSRYMEVMSQFYGIERYDCLCAEGLDLGIRPVEDIMKDAFKKAEEAAKAF